jgi:hypothetical protein
MHVLLGPGLFRMAEKEDVARVCRFFPGFILGRCPGLAQASTGQTQKRRQEGEADRSLQ